MSKEGRELPKTNAQKRHNPGNIKFSANNQWIGQLPSQLSEFAEFVSDWAGYRAIFIILKRYHDYDHCLVVKDFISRWAPPETNNVPHYLQFLDDNYALAEWIEIQAPADYLLLGIAIMDYESRWFANKKSGLVNAWADVFGME